MTAIGPQQPGFSNWKITDAAFTEGYKKIEKFIHDIETTPKEILSAELTNILSYLDEFDDAQRIQFDDAKRSLDQANLADKDQRDLVIAKFQEIIHPTKVESATAAKSETLLTTSLSSTNIYRSEHFYMNLEFAQYYLQYRNDLGRARDNLNLALRYIDTSDPAYKKIESVINNLTPASRSENVKILQEILDEKTVLYDDVIKRYIRIIKDVPLQSAVTIIELTLSRDLDKSDISALDRKKVYEAIEFLRKGDKETTLKMLDNIINPK